MYLCWINTNPKVVFDPQNDTVGEGAKDAYLIRGHVKIHWINTIPKVVFGSQSEALRGGVAAAYLACKDPLDKYDSESRL